MSPEQAPDPMEATDDLVYRIAERVKALADLPMPVLRKVAEANGSCCTRGQILEWAITEEFIKEK